MPALALNPRCKGLFAYTCSDITWTGPQSESPEPPETPISASASELSSSSGSSHTLRRNSPSAHTPSPTRARSSSYAPETPTRSPSYTPETPTRSPSPYTPDTPSPWMTTLTSNAAAAITSVRDLGTAQRPTLPSIATLLHNPTNPPPSTPNWLPPLAARTPLTQPMHPPNPLRPARTAASPPSHSPGPGLLFFTARRQPSVVVQPVPRRVLGVEERFGVWDGIVRGWEGEIDKRGREVRGGGEDQRWDVGDDEMGEEERHRDVDHEDDRDPDDWAVGDVEASKEEEGQTMRLEVEVPMSVNATRYLVRLERRWQERQRWRMHALARRGCLRGGMGFGTLRVRGS